MREMTHDPQTDTRLEKVETVTISFETFKKALKRNYLGICEWPTEANTRDALSEEEIEEDGGIEEAVEIGREIFWDEVKHDLPETFNLGRVQGVGNYTVELNWEE